MSGPKAGRPGSAEPRGSRDAGNSAVRLWRSVLRAYSTVRREVRRELARWNLTGAQFGVLRVLGEAGDAGIPLNEIGQRLFVTRGNVTGVVDRLEKSGLVCREAYPSDRRITLARLTPKGSALYAKVRPAVSARVTELLAALSPAECEQLADRLDAAVDGMPATRRRRRAT
jgi:MarR family 2-MHQ and catechol resistance regulon transcriptional repressor